MCVCMKNEIHSYYVQRSGDFQKAKGVTKHTADHNKIADHEHAVEISHN